jgi:hypothetical protein
MNGVHQPECDPPEISADVFAASTIDQLDASDVIFCISRRVQDDLHRFAAETGRPTPNSRLLPPGADLPLTTHDAAASPYREIPDLTLPTWDACAAVVRDGLLSLMDCEPALK